MRQELASPPLHSALPANLRGGALSKFPRAPAPPYEESPSPEVVWAGVATGAGPSGFAAAPAVETATSRPWCPDPGPFPPRLAPPLLSVSSSAWWGVPSKAQRFDSLDMVLSNPALSRGFPHRRAQWRALLSFSLLGFLVIRTRGIYLLYILSCIRIVSGHGGGAGAGAGRHGCR